MSTITLVFLMGCAMLCVHAQSAEYEDQRSESEDQKIKYEALLEILAAETRQRMEDFGQLKQDMLNIQVRNVVTILNCKRAHLQTE